MKKITNLLLLMMFMSSMVVFGQTSFNSTNSTEEAQMMEHQRPVSPDAKNQLLPADMLKAKGSSTFTVPGNGSRAVSNIKIDFTVDNNYTEANYNLYSYSAGAYYWGSPQGFSSPNQTITHILALTEGNVYAIVCFDTQGNGGIAGEVSNNDTGWFIMSWDKNYSGAWAFFNFTAGDGIPPVEYLPITEFPFLADFEDGVVEGGYVEPIINDQSDAYLSADAANASLFGFMMTGGNFIGWTGGSASGTYENAFTDNVTHHSDLVMEVHPTPNDPKDLILKFDMRQIYKGGFADEWFRVLVDGVPIADLNGNTYWNPTSAGIDPWQTLTFNLSAFKNLASFQIILQNSAKIVYTSSIFGITGDAAMIDNVEIIYTVLGLVINNPVLDLGDRPIDAWMKPASYEIFNNLGVGNFSITAADIDDNFGGFLAVDTPSLPYTLVIGATTFDFGIGTTDEVVTEGAFAGNFALFYGESRALSTATYLGNAYTPDEGDVWELAFDGNAATFPETVAMGTFRDNYDMPGIATDGWDAVYELTFTTDVVFNATLTAADAKVALYPVGFEGVGGPDMDNELTSGTTALVDIELTTGTYFMAVSSTGADYVLDVTFPDMPLPDAATYVAPFDGETGVINGDDLVWTFGANTVNYQVILGTTYPPTDVVVDWTDNLAELYTLVNTQPNLQYFWQVNTGNSTGTTPGDIWGFTADITPPAGLEVVLTDPGENSPTVSTLITWDANATRAFLGYNLYRNGVQLNADLLTVETYSDLDLARDASYTYYATSVFDQGESAPSNDTTVTALGVGTFNGVVTDALTTDPIENVSVNILGTGYSYYLTTNALGEYTTLAYAGTYNIGLNSPDYQPASAGPIVLAHAATETNDFALSEAPLPVGDVVAWELNEDNVRISWGGALPPEPNTEWLGYGDGTATDGWWFASGLPFNTAINFDPDDLTELDGTYLTKFAIYNRSDDASILKLYEGDYMGYNATLIHQQDVVSDVIDEWIEIELTAAIPLDITQQLWVVVERPSVTTWVSASASEINSKGDWYSGGPNWFHIGTTVWNMNIFVTDALTNRTSEIVRRPQDPSKNYENTFGDAVAAEGIEANIKPFRPELNTRAIESYDVYRHRVYQPEAAVLVGNTTQQDFVDFDWGIQDWGVYRWSVVVNYTGQVSPPTYSNTLETDMEILVSALVNTNSGDSPQGTSVTFTNTSEVDEAGNPIYMFGALLDNLGFVEWDDFRRGTYDIEVFLPGFTSINLTGIDIFDDEDFEWMLEEILQAPLDLYVTPTGHATWIGDWIEFEPYVENFDVDPTDWTIVPGGSSSDTWFWTTNYSGNTLSDSPFMFVDSDATGIGVTMDELLISPVIEGTEYATSLQIEFDQYYNNLSSLESADVEVFDGNNWVTVLHQNSTQGAWFHPWSSPDHVVIDVSAYANSEFRVRFHYIAPTWDWYWAVDNFVVSDAAQNRKPNNRAFELYKIFHDGALITDVITSTEYQYGTEGEVLVAGETYTAGVAAVFTMGQSATAEFDWIYVPCGNYDAPTAFAAAQDEGTLDITLEWTNADAAALDTIDGVLVYRDGELYDAVDFASGVVNTYTDGPLEFGTYSYCITYVYESGAETCQGVVCSGDVEINGNAAVDGFVLQDAYLGGAPIEGAEVYIVNVDFPEIDFSFDADDTGAYGGSVIAGTYDYTVSAWGYITETLEGVVIPLNGTVTNNFELDEFPAPPVAVVATELNDDEVLLTWHDPQTLIFEPYVADMSVGVPEGWVIDPVAMPTWFWTESAYGNQLGGKEFMFADSEATGFGIYMHVSMTTPVIEYTMGQPLLLLNFDQYFDQGFDQDAYADVEVFDGNNWIVVAHQAGSDKGSWTSPDHQSIDVTAYANPAFQVRFTYSATWDYWWAINNVVVTNAVTRSGEPILTSKPTPTREMTGYEIYRTTCETGDLQFIGFVPATDSAFTDHNWGSVDPNVYKWGVVAQYEQNVSEVTFSNCLDKDMITDVNVTVTTNSGDSPVGTFVQFTNTSEPDLGLVYEVTLDESGYFAWDDFRLGVYDISVDKFGFISLEIEDEFIYTPTDFVWVLEEFIAPVVNLHVAPTALATWDRADAPSRELEYYKVWLDGTFIENVQETYYQHSGDFITGVEYYTEVAAMYTNGMSAKEDYYWTYMACDSFPGPANLTGEIEGINDVLLTWGETLSFSTEFIVNEELAAIAGDLITINNSSIQYENLRDDVLWSENWEDPQTSTNGIITTYYGGLSAGTVTADDFIVPVGQDWTISAFAARGFLTSGVPEPNGFGYTIYGDDGGQPGNVLFENLNAGTSDPTLVEIDLGTPITLTSGTYWVAIYAYYENASTLPEGRWNQYTWNPASTPGNLAMLNDFADLFGMGSAGWNSLPSLGIDATSLDFAVIGAVNGGGGGGFDPGPVIGANIYRDGALIAEMVQETFYVDQSVDYGIYEYCVNLLYEDMAESCTESCIDIEVTEDCVAPTNLTAELEGDNLVHLLWEHALMGEWLYYDDGINIDAIGGSESFSWAIKFDPAQLTEFDGASVTKISIYCWATATNTLQIFEGPAASTLLFSQDISELEVGAWNEVELSSPVAIDISKELWITVYTTEGMNYPAACGTAMGEPNGDLITLDGIEWRHLTDYNLSFTWNLRAFVTDETSTQVQLGSIVNDNIYDSEGTLAATGIVNTSENAVLDMSADASRDFLGYNIYKDGELLEALWADKFYDYDEMQIGYNCYTITSEYSYCGESDPSNEACVDITVGINELTANDVLLYPNPAKDMVTVISTMPITRLAVTNYIGQIVYGEVNTTNKVVLDTQSYLSGIYLVKIETENGVVTKRVIITK